jgi:hypothetical protein
MFSLWSNKRKKNYYIRSIINVGVLVQISYYGSEGVPLFRLNIKLNVLITLPKNRDQVLTSRSLAACPRDIAFFSLERFNTPRHNTPYIFNMVLQY